MRLSQIHLAHFRCFESRTFEFHPNVNLVVGVNGSGKTALLDAISVALSTWLLGFKSRTDNMNISMTDVHLKHVQANGEHRYVQQWPVEISGQMMIDDKSIGFSRSRASQKGTTRYSQAKELIDLARQYDKELANSVKLPLIACYGTMRLWQDPKAVINPDFMADKFILSPLEGYRYSVDPRINSQGLVDWFAKQAWVSFQQSQEPVMLKVVRKAVLACIDGAEDLMFDAKRGELMLRMSNQTPLPFGLLSDGQRSMLAMIADIAQKAAKLNYHLGEKVLEQTQGVVLIDELDLHLHPKWQRGIIENLRTVFPKIQFICTTHSPFLIQSLRSSEELLMLDGVPLAQLANKPLEVIASGIMGVVTPQYSERYSQMKQNAKDYLQVLNEAQNAPAEKLADYKERLAQSVAPFADNPAYQAVLEMQRIATLGE